MSTVNSHLNRISQSYTLQPAPASTAGFGVWLVLVDEAGGTGLGGDRARLYENSSDVDDDVTAGEVSSDAAALVKAALAQPNVESVLLGRVDTVALEGYDDGLAAVEVAGHSFYGFSIDSRVAADILDASSAAETRNVLFGLQSGDADWKTTGFPASLSAVEGRERSFICYHDTDTEPMDAAYGANRLVFDPDDLSYTWTADVKEVANYATAPTAAEKAFLEENHCNVGLPLGSADFFVMPGVNANGRPLYQIVTIDWLKARLDEDIAKWIVDNANRGTKITIDDAGQRAFAGIIRKRLLQGEAAGHFLVGEAEVTTPAITDDDRDNTQLRARARGAFAQGAVKFDLGLNFSTSLISE